MKRILVAIDGSEGADRAVDYAARWATSEGADLLIVNIVGGYGLPESVVGSFSHTQQVWLDELLIAASAEMLTKARERARGLGVSTVHLESRPGGVAETIIEVAQEKKADVIVVGKRGSGRIAGLLLGSVSQKLVSLAPLPVAVIP